MAANKSSQQTGLKWIWLSLLAALFLRWLVGEVFTIPNGSMLPTLFKSDYVFVSKLKYGLRSPFSDSWLIRWAHPDRDQVVLLKSGAMGSSLYIKRIVAAPGDKIQITGGQLLLNDQIVERGLPPAGGELIYAEDSDFQEEDHPYDGKNSYVEFSEKLTERQHSILVKRGEVLDAFGPLILKEGEYFLLGDSRNSSVDSRLWGAIEEKDIFGEARRIVFSCQRFWGWFCNPASIRWDRIAKRVE